MDYEKKEDVVNFYIIQFFSYPKDMQLKWIKEWILLLKCYKKLPNFVKFIPNTPIMSGIKRKAKGIILVNNYDTANKLKFKYKRYSISIFPLLPLKICLDDKCISFPKEKAIELLYTYIEMSKIKYIAIHYTIKSISIKSSSNLFINELKDKFPDLLVYTPGLFKYFFKIIIK